MPNGMSLEGAVGILVLVAIVYAQIKWSKFVTSSEDDLKAKWERVDKLQATRLRLAKRVKALTKRTGGGRG